MLLLQTSFVGHMPSTKHCAKCDRVRSATLFYKRAQNKDGLSSYCKDCWKLIIKSRKKKMYAQQAEYREEHKAERQENYKRYWQEKGEILKARRRARYAARKKEAAKAAKNKK